MNQYTSKDLLPYVGSRNITIEDKRGDCEPRIMQSWPIRQSSVDPELFGCDLTFFNSKHVTDIYATANTVHITLG